MFPIFKKQLPGLILLILGILNCSTTQQTRHDTPIKYSPRVSIKIGMADLTHFPEVRFRLFIHNARGLPLTHLAPPYCEACQFWRSFKEFHPRYGMQPISRFEIREYQPSIPGKEKKYIPHYVVLVLDVSASMNGEPLDQAKQAAIHFVQRTAAQIALLSFETKTTRVLDFTSNSDSLKQRIMSLKSGGGTRLYNALYEAIQLIEHQKGYRNIVVLTDGETGGDDYTLEEIIKLARQSQIALADGGTASISLFPIGLNYNSETLQTLARSTDGQFYHASSQTDLEKIFHHLSDSLKSEFYYEFKFNSIWPQADGYERLLHFNAGDTLLTYRYTAPLSETVFELTGRIYAEDSLTTIAQAKIIAHQTSREINIAGFSALDGEYRLEVPRHFGRYHFVVEGPPEYFVALHDTFLDLREKFYVEKDFYLPKLEKNATLILWTIYFSKNEYQIQEHSIPNLKLLADYFRHRPHLKYEIRGHTDDQGSTEHNQQLSERRAQSVRQFFIRQGISAQKMLAIGFGESKPLVPNTSSENRRLNRRVELKLTQVDSKASP